MNSDLKSIFGFLCNSYLSIDMTKSKSKLVSKGIVEVCWMACLVILWTNFKEYKIRVWHLHLNVIYEHHQK